MCMSVDPAEEQTTSFVRGMMTGPSIDWKGPSARFPGDQMRSDYEGTQKTSVPHRRSSNNRFVVVAALQEYCFHFGLGAAVR